MRMTPRTLLGTGLGFLSLAAATSALTFVARVEQEATPGGQDWVHKGWIAPYETPRTIEDEYGWSVGELRYGGASPGDQDP